MASFTVEKRKTAAGVIRYRCIVRVKKDKAIVYQESRTFGKLADARTWGKAMVSHIETQGIPGQAPDMPTIRELIAMYQQDPDISKKIGRTKGYVLSLLADSDISKLQADKLTTMAIINHCRDRNAAGAKPQTVAQDISYLKSVYMSAKPVFGIPVTDEVIREVIPVLHSMGLIGRSERRSRRPTSDELDRLRQGLLKRMSHRGSKIPLTDILDFSILSCMRISEVCAIRWDDIDEAARAVMVRNRKDPRKKAGNHMWVPLLGDAWSIVQRQPKEGELVFPYESRSVTAAFQRVRNALGIEDLRYHDLRREGASRLFEAGFGIEEVAQVTGHRSLNLLWQVYTELFPGRLHAKMKADS
ncbi:tyrosine-type recombinase/integrase [Oceanimonas baumannii]|uniref:Integrase n=1 Tax=Oceanimonas baumannii TaxID=129578 RepID=A0A235CLW5_9GAMM|nr:site-specific integrase [Oceanimonas baumannii]OYD25429.1 integrase [Oceanimonas baumannii]TDW61375.1 site-specific recombinase XerD [Oceanimonas baumannii]